MSICVSVRVNEVFALRSVCVFMFVFVFVFVLVYAHGVVCVGLC